MTWSTLIEAISPHMSAFNLFYYLEFTKRSLGKMMEELTLI